MHIVPSELGKWAYFGVSVAIDDDVMAVCAIFFINNGEERQGCAYVYCCNATTWTEETKLTPPNDSDAEYFGISVSVKDNTIIVGDGYYGDNNEGVVFVYGNDPSSNSWNQVGGILMNNDCHIFVGGLVRLMHDDAFLVSCGDWGSAGNVY